MAISKAEITVLWVNLMHTDIQSASLHIEQCIQNGLLFREISEAILCSTHCTPYTTYISYKSQIVSRQWDLHTNAAVPRYQEEETGLTSPCYGDLLWFATAKPRGLLTYGLDSGCTTGVSPSSICMYILVEKSANLRLGVHLTWAFVACVARAKASIVICCEM